MIHSSYYDYAAHMRVCYLNESGFSMQSIAKLGIGPILFKESCTFIKEIHPSELITYNILAGEMTDDGGKWVMHHEVFNQKGVKAAQITVHGAWMDIRARKLTLPPQEIKELFMSLPKGEEYVYGQNS
jgi:acyl-CoA thioester hydrolase